MKEQKKFAFLFHFLKEILIIVIVLFLINFFVLTLHRANENNMFPHVKYGDLCILYKLEKCHAGDVVAYKIDGKTKLGRIIATEGQTIDFPESGGFLINDSVASEEITYQTYKNKDANIQYPLTIKENSYFIMNDFRSDVEDSRTYGLIDANSIKGKIVFILRRRSF